MRTLLVAGAFAVLLTAACGDDDDEAVTPSGPGTGETTTTAAAGGSAAAPVQLEGAVNDEGGTGEVSDGSVEMELDDFYFGPTFTRAGAGTTVTVELHNEGEAPHTFTVDSLGVDVEVPPGETSSVEVTLPGAGAVRYYCRFHAGGGMQGAFYANEGDAVGAASIPSGFGY